MKLEILYEDNHLIVVLKPAGILSQEDYTKDPDMLSLLKQYIKEKYNKPGNVYLGLVMRLDRMTSGIMVFAKTSKAASRLSEQIKKHELKKKYLAVVEGNTKQSGTLKHYLVKDEKLVKSFVANEGKLAELDYEKIGFIDNLSLVKVDLHTGRHHQIRVQFSYIGHPLYGDHLYGGHGDVHMQLHAFKLSFLHPITKEELEFTNMPKGEIWDKFNLNNYEL
jgi:23S rRNA pseudouridine1911/1915/1917 synthase